MKLNFCAGNPPADAELTGRAESKLTEKNLNWTFVQAIHQQMLNLLKRQKLNLMKKNWNWTFVQAIHQQMLNLLKRLKLNLLKKT